MKRYVMVQRNPGSRAEMKHHLSGGWIKSEDHDAKVKKLKEALDRIGLLSKNLVTDADISVKFMLMGLDDICQIAIEALKG